MKSYAAHLKKNYYTAWILYLFLQCKYFCQEAPYIYRSPGGCSYNWLSMTVCSLPWFPFENKVKLATVKCNQRQVAYGWVHQLSVLAINLQRWGRGTWVACTFAVWSVMPAALWYKLEQMWHINDFWYLPLVLFRNIVAIRSFHGSWKRLSCTKLYGDLGGVHFSAGSGGGGFSFNFFTLVKYGLCFFAVDTPTRKIKLWLDWDLHLSDLFFTSNTFYHRKKYKSILMVFNLNIYLKAHI